MTQPHDHDADATDPAEALADVWQMLDALPAAAASSDMMATTIEMAAVSMPEGFTAMRAENSQISMRTPSMNTASMNTANMSSASVTTASSSGRTVRGIERSALGWWLPAAAVVLVSLIVGMAAGRATAPNPELGVLANLPIAQHVDLLREAGSVAFLEEVAKRGYPPPRRKPLAQTPADVRADAQEFDAAIEAIKSIAAVEAKGQSRSVLAARREQVLELPEWSRRQLEKSVESYQRLSAADRRELTSLGRALADPDRDSLVQAARLWHQWIELRDPADRRDVIDLNAADRLEWLDRWTRLDARNDTRMEFKENARQFYEREWPNRRRPPPEANGGNFPRPPGQPAQPRPPGQNAQPRQFGPPRPRGPAMGPGPDGSRAGPGPDGPRFNAREPQPPVETPPPPR